MQLTLDALKAHEMNLIYIIVSHKLKWCPVHHFVLTQIAWIMEYTSVVTFASLYPSENEEDFFLTWVLAGWWYYGTNDTTYMLMPDVMT